MLRVSFFLSVCLHLVLLGVASVIIAQRATPELPVEKRFRVNLQENVVTTAGLSSAAGPSAGGSSFGPPDGDTRLKHSERSLPPSPEFSPEATKRGEFPSELSLPASQAFSMPQSPLQKTQRVKPEEIQPRIPIMPPPLLKKQSPNVQTTQTLTPTMPEFVAQARDFPTPIPTKRKPIPAKSTPIPGKPTPISAKPTPIPANPAPVLAKSTPIPTDLTSISAESTRIPAGISETREQPQPVETPGISTSTASIPPGTAPRVAGSESSSQSDVTASVRRGSPTTGTTPGTSSNSEGAMGDAGNEPGPQGNNRPKTPREKTLLNQYLQEVAAKIKAVKQYPRNARAEGWEGTVVIKLRILPSGKVETVEFAEKSPYESLNEAAFQTIQQAQPFPPFSRGLTLQSITVNIPIKFTLN